jgi:hypothetical protein
MRYSTHPSMQRTKLVEPTRAPLPQQSNAPGWRRTDLSALQLAQAVAADPMNARQIVADAITRRTGNAPAVKAASPTTIPRPSPVGPRVGAGRG